MHLLQKLWQGFVPPTLRSYIYHLRSHFDIIEIQSGNFRSVREKMAVDKHGQPLPWYTYPAIEFLRQIDFTNKEVFEFGSGNSTLFWSQRAKSVTSVEHDPEWFDLVHSRSSMLANVSIVLRVEKEAYVNEIRRHFGFDVVVIDGLCRLTCVRESLRALRPGGIIILDNSDVCPKSSRHLRQSDLIQVSMTGFGPGIPTVWTTSIFLHRGFSMPQISDLQQNGERPGAPYDD